jgi:nickel-dependent lactate racemase
MPAAGQESAALSMAAAKQRTVPFSLIVSIGQVVPHEIAGMANHAKNIFVGTGGAEAIHKSHWLGALYGLERLMGVTENPVRALFDEALRRYGRLLPPILWILTVVDWHSRVRGLFCGFGRKCFEDAAALAAELNIERVSAGPHGTGALEAGGIRKAVVWLDGEEYRSAWLGNKAVYRTRRALADGGELIILAPGLDRFGEDPALDALLRRYGYRGTAAIRRAVEEGGELAENLSAAAHLIHGSSEGRFTIRYCTPAGGGNSGGPSAALSRADIEGAGYEWGGLEEAAARYVPLGPDKQNPGWNITADGERYYFIRNPALGLWV